MIKDEKVYRYEPEYAVPPGVTLLETIEYLEISQAELAERTGRPKKTINEIIMGKAAITPETALQFERVLGVPAALWNNLERNYREMLARGKELCDLKNKTQWLKMFPEQEMIRYGWIKKHDSETEQVREMLGYFGVASVDSWEAVWCKAQASFRMSNVYISDLGSIAAWLRKGEIDGKKIRCNDFNASTFKKTLGEVRSLTKEPPEVFVPAVTKHCASAGVAVVFVPELPGCRINGATYWLSPRKALIQLSLRYKSDDHLWFTFFHEAAHILLHGKRKTFIEVDNNKGELEGEADRFAENFLIPSASYKKFVERSRYSYDSVRQYATSLGIAPGIVVGRLQHDKIISYDRLNKLKRSLRWSFEKDKGRV